MADVATVNVPERSLFERVARVPSLLNQGVESMVAGTLSLPALVADGYINIYRTARQSMGGQAFEASNMFDRSKATLTDAGRTLDGSKGKVIQAETTTEKGIVFGTELVTGLVGPGALKSLKTLSEGATFAKTATVAKTEAATANVTAATAPATTTTAASSKVRLATANEDVLSILAKAKAEGEAARAGVTAAKAADTVGDAAKVTASAADDAAKVASASAAAKASYGTSDILKVLKREKDLPARLEALSGHGAKADAMVERLIAGARKSGLSGDDWRAIQNSRSLSPDVMKKVDDIYNATKNSAWGIGPAWERAKGTAAYWQAYPVESLARASAAPLSVPFKLAGASFKHSPVATAIGLGSVGYVGYGALANSLSSPSSARDVSLTESLAKSGSQALIDASKFSAASLWTAGALAAAKLPGIGDAALDGLRGTARTLVTEMAEGEPDEALAWQLAQEKLSKFLPKASVDAMGEFVAGKDLKAMTAEQRTRITDAMEAVSNPRGDKAKALLHAATDEAKQRTQRIAQDAPSVFTQGAQAAASSVGGAVSAAGEYLEDTDFSEMFGTMKQLAKDNPYFSVGMTLGAAYGVMGAGKSKTERAMGAAVYGMVFGFAFQILGQLYPGLVPGLMKMVGAAPDALAKVPGAIGLNTSSLNGGFKAAAEGTTPAPASVPAQDQPRTAVASKFDQAASGMPPALAPAPELDVDLQRKRPEAANNSAYRMTIGA